MASTQPAKGREVSIFGTDASGKPFFQTACVVSSDGFEVTLEGMHCRLDVSNVVGLRHAGQKGRFQVVSVGREGTPQQGQVCLRALEPGKNILGAGVGAASVPAPKSSYRGRDRRSQPRIPCQGGVKFRREGTVSLDAGILRCLNEGGCYIETEATAPCSSLLDLVLNVEGLELSSVGVVRASDPAGMGIAFGEMNPAYRSRLQEWVFQRSRE